MKGGAPPGERHHAAKLTEAQVRTIRRQYATGRISHLELAVQYGLATSSIGAILQRRTWRHVEDDADGACWCGATGVVADRAGEAWQLSCVNGHRILTDMKRMELTRA